MVKTEKTKALVKYVADMHDRSEEYEYNPIEVLEALDEASSEVSDEMQEIYKGLSGDRVCPRCRTSKMYDEANEEFYCPIHG